MKIVQPVSRVGLCVFLIPALMCMPGCDWFKGSDTAAPASSAGMAASSQAVNDGSPVLFSMEGKPVVTEKMVEDRINTFRSVHPELFSGKEAEGLMDNLKCMLANDMLMTALVDRDLEAQGVKRSAEYLQKVQEAVHEAEQKVKLEYFVSTISVNDRDVRDYYNERKDSFAISRGGRKTMAVSFSDADKAAEFAGKVKDADGDIEKAAKDGGHEMKDLDFVHDRSIGIDPDLRAKIVAERSGPFTKVFKLEDGTVWVVRATEEKGVEYASMEDVSDQLRQMLQGKKAEERMNQLREKYNVKPGEAAAKYKGMMGDGGMDAGGMDDLEGPDFDAGPEEQE